MTPLPLRRVVDVAAEGEDQRRTFLLDCGHAFTCDDRRVASGIARHTHLRCATCAAAAARAEAGAEATLEPRRARLRERRCARCGQIDVRPCYSPPPPACFRCRARVFVEFFDDDGS
ncbi:MAG: hypothetical protein JOZ69_07975 [Myxococcales bacterium]|nr:hypothetical protein [Myxococcales bacterium]